MICKKHNVEYEPYVFKGQNRFYCPVCDEEGKAFLRSLSERKPIKSKDVIKKEKRTCIVCGRRINTSNDTCYACKSKIKHNTCIVCGISIDNYTGVCNTCSSTIKKPYKCTNCGRRIQKYTGLCYECVYTNDHKQKHTCEICGCTSFTEKSNTRCWRHVNFKNQMKGCVQKPSGTRKKYRFVIRTQGKENVLAEFDTYEAGIKYKIEYNQTH